MTGVSGLSGISSLSGVFGGRFLPTDLAGLILWLKADAGTYQDNGFSIPAASDGDSVGGWQDQSGNGNDVTQAVAANKPTLKLAIKNGLSVIRFDGINDRLQGVFGGALSQPFHIFAVAVLDATVVNDGLKHDLIDSDDAANRMILLQDPTDAPDEWTIYGGTTLFGNASNSNWNIWTVLFNGASSRFSINNTSQATGNAGAHNADGITIGARWSTASEFWKGDISELLIYDPSLSIGDRQQVEQYLSTRWDITLA